MDRTRVGGVFGGVFGRSVCFFLKCISTFFRKSRACTLSYIWYRFPASFKSCCVLDLGLLVEGGSDFRRFFRLLPSGETGIDFSVVAVAVGWVSLGPLLLLSAYVLEGGIFSDVGVGAERARFRADIQSRWGRVSRSRVCV